MFTVSHELAHFMRDFAPEQFDTYAKFLFDNYAKKGLSVRRAVHEEMMKHQNLRYDEAYEEVVARLSESFLRDAHLTEKSRELYNIDKTVWEKIRDGLKDIVDRIKEYFGDLSPDSELGKLGAKMVRENQEILDLFVQGIRNASENLAYIENTDGKAKEMARYAKKGGKFSNALTDKEWGIFYSSAMKGNQRTSFRIGDDGVVLLGDKFSKVVYYEDVDGDLEVKAVYKVENYDYNIHENIPNAFDTLIMRERLKDNATSRRERDRIEKQTRAILESNSALYGTVFSKYNGQSHRFNLYSRGGNKTGRNSIKEPDGARVSGRTEQTGGVKYQSRDADYLAAAESGDVIKARRMVKEAAKAAGYDTTVLYHGTPSFGFTQFKSTIFLTDKPETAMGYGGGKGYAELRAISDQYIPDDGTDNTLIKNAKRILHLDLREITKADIGKVKNDFKSRADEIADKVNEAWIFREGFPEMPYEIETGLSWMLSMPISLSENYEEIFNGEEDYIKETSDDIERFNRYREQVRDWFLEHRQEIINAGNEDVYRLMTGFELSDFAIDVEYTLLRALDTQNNLVSSYGGYINKEQVRSRVEAQKNLGSYSLYANVGDNPLTIECDGKFWANVPTPPELGEITYTTTDSIVKMARDAGYTSVIFRNLLDPAMNDFSPNIPSDVYAIFDSNNVKSADPVTYDDNGEVIPLSERFNSEEKDIRYDSRDSDLFGDEDILFSEYDDIADVVKRQYTTHSEAIGEVLKNTADIDIAAGKVKNIVSRLINALTNDASTVSKLLLTVLYTKEQEIYEQSFFCHF